MSENIEEIDYSKIGFKAGLEIHQQLDSHKLFCECPSVLRQESPDREIVRKLHAVAGESGSVDEAAIYQARLKKEFVYQFYEDTNCLVELDEEPPHKINKEALKIAVQISLLMNCEILPISQIMRKTVIDGSNTSGFQRTVMIAHSGFLETSQGRVGIDAIMLEEDAARIVERGKKKEIYRLDRLGIPLVEVVTKPDLKDNKHAQEVALLIGNILRSCKVRRGLGTIRQDVSVSVKRHNRVELKGVQDINLFPKTVENEVKRQMNLEKKGNPTSSEVRNALSDGTTEFLRPMPGSARMYPETDLPLLKISRDFINEAKKNLPKLKSEEEKELKKQGLSQEIIKLLFKENKLEEFEFLLKFLNEPVFVGKVLLTFTKEISSKHKEKNVREILNGDLISEILGNVANGKISRDRVKNIMEKIVEGKSLKEAVEEKVNINDVEEKIIGIIRTKPGLSSNAYMGLIMKEFKGNISGKEASEIIKKHVQ
jgi:Glu-tRNA(Gln) amidotransferase subunit E-like FAD-binding protein